MEFRILGSVELWSDGHQYDLGTVKERSVLAVLLLTPGQPVSPEKLMNRVWDENPPPRARDSLYTYVSRLRSRFNHIGDDALIASSRTGGYVLETDQQAIDLYRFQLLRAQAGAIAESGDDEHAVTLYREAAQLWRAEPLADLPGNWAARARKSIEDELLAATFDRVSIELRLGNHADLVGELSELVERYPFDERLVEDLMMALYRSGRQADALQTYREAGHRLREELGTEANPDLQELHQRILRGDRRLLPAPRVQPDAPRPNSLPLDTRFFTGREAELTELLEAASSTPPTAPQAANVIAIDGMAGIGKTVFAVHLAYKLADQYPDAQLYLNLHAYDADQTAIDPSTALDILLRMLGIPAGRIPRTLDDRAALWRTELAHRRVLILLDNAAGHEQLRPLFPGTPGCLTLITSRRRLVGLDDVTSRSLDVLGPADAATLFTRIVGPGQPADDDVVAVVRLCGYLPMAIQLVANRLRHRPAWSVSNLADRLAQDSRRLGEIRAENREIIVAFELSYRELTAQQRQAFRRLGLHVGSDFTKYAAAAAIDCSAPQADRLIDDLLEHHLITEPIGGRFRFHDLIRDYARYLADLNDSEDERRYTIQRVLDHHLSTAARADLLLYPGRQRASVGSIYETSDPVPMETEEQAREWMRAELENTLRAAEHAASQSWPRYTALLAMALAQYLETWGHWERATYLHKRAISAWRELGDDAGVAQALSDVSIVHFRSGHYGEALSNANEALAIYRSMGNSRGEADILEHVSLIYWHWSQFGDALRYCRNALAIRRSLGDRRGEAQSLDHAAIFLEYTGRYAEASEHREHALAIYSEVDDLRGKQMALNNSGDLQMRLGRFSSALDYYKEAMGVASEMSRQHEAIWLSNIASIYQHTGRPDDALREYRRALPTYQVIGDRRSEIETLVGIGATFQLMGHSGEALVHFQRALVISREISERYEETKALRCVGDALLSSGRYNVALDHYRQALDLSHTIGDPFEEAKATEGIGTALLHVSGRTQARRHWKEALRTYERLGVPEIETVRSYLQESDNAIGT